MWNRSFLILHGVENRRPAEHWQYDLAQRLRQHGEQVFYPQLPDPDRPTLAAWVGAIEAELGMMRGERVVVCHSLACAAWFHVSAGSEWFQCFLRGEPPYDEFFITVEPGTDLSGVTRPRTTPLLTRFETSKGPRWVWTTFGPDQVDLDDVEDFYIFKRLGGLESVEATRTPEAEVLEGIPDSEVKEALESIPEQFRMAVILADVEGFSYKEIADIMDVPIGTVMSRIHRGRRALQKALYEFGQARGLVAQGR